jgi:hypothetical protein
MDISDRLESQIRQLQELHEMVTPRPTRQTRAKRATLSRAQTEPERYQEVQAVERPAKAKRALTERQLESLQRGREKRMQMLKKLPVETQASVKRPVIKRNEKVYF